MIKIISLITFSLILLQGCSNKYTGIGFPYSISSNQEKIDNIELPEEGQDVIKATEEIYTQRYGITTDAGTLIVHA